jgi:hypothetical protein
MPDSDSKLQRSTNLLNAWFVKLDKEKRNLLKSGRFRLLMLSLSILILLLLNLVGVLAPGSSIAFNLQPYTAWMHGRLDAWLRNRIATPAVLADLARIIAAIVTPVRLG